MVNKYRSIQRTMLPFDYEHVDRSSAKAYYKWRNYITAELAKDMEDPMELLLLQYKKVLAEKSTLTYYPVPAMLTPKRPLTIKSLMFIQLVVIIVLLACIYYQMEVKNG